MDGECAEILEVNPSDENITISSDTQFPTENINRSTQLSDIEHITSPSIAEWGFSLDMSFLKWLQSHGATTDTLHRLHIYGFNDPNLLACMHDEDPFTMGVPHLAQRRLLICLRNYLINLK